MALPRTSRSGLSVPLLSPAALGHRCDRAQSWRDYVERDDDGGGVAAAAAARAALARGGAHAARRPPEVASGGASSGIWSAIGRPLKDRSQAATSTVA